MPRALVAMALLVLACRDHAKPAPSTGDAYRLEPGPRTPCAAKTECEARLAFSTLGDRRADAAERFHFIADPGLEVTGQAFTLDDASHGTLAIRFRAPRPGTAKVTGTLQFSTCRASTCTPGEAKVALDVPVD